MRRCIISSRNAHAYEEFQTENTTIQTKLSKRYYFMTHMNKLFLNLSRFTHLFFSKLSNSSVTQNYKVYILNNIQMIN